MADTVDMTVRIAELERRLADVERRERDERKVGNILRDLMPPDVRTHLRAAQKEQLLAARSFLDHWIGKIEKDDTPRGRESITVD